MGRCTHITQLLSESHWYFSRMSFNFQSRDFRGEINLKSLKSEWLIGSSRTDVIISIFNLIATPLNFIQTDLNWFYHLIFVERLVIGLTVSPFPVQLTRVRCALSLLIVSISIELPLISQHFDTHSDRVAPIADRMFCQGPCLSVAARIKIPTSPITTSRVHCFCIHNFNVLHNSPLFANKSWIQRE